MYQDTIAFYLTLQNKSINDAGIQTREQNKSSLQSIFLLSDSNPISIFDKIPKDFTISTKNGKCLFNLEMLKEASPVINDLVNGNQNERDYFLDINDEENVLGKYERLFLGQTVDFVEDDFHCSKQITKLLQIQNCPNPLKPQTLQRNTRTELRYRSLFKAPTLPISIGIKYLIKFFNRDVYKTFKIIIKKNEYICSIFGVYSSNVIRKILNENHDSNQFVYDFEDEFNEFQSICDFLNFKEVGLTRNNMNSIKKIVDDLQIDCISDQVNSFIDNYDKN